MDWRNRRPEVLVLEVRRAFQRHRAANVDVGGFDVLFREAEMGQQVEGRDRPAVLGRNFKRGPSEFFAKRPLVEDELDVEG